ncbi:Uncharacterised protein [Bordetella pertussis]|nr:Uncharacterised protein [Bordetella pertussis]CFP68020.1 Uncharacterised protein [Bordetella pertussis]CFT92922.1 Uncharacterised protein [Bordetella pertussis]CFW01960.1 Uncharacterised protein [Bordetella pertussis]
MKASRRCSNIFSASGVKQASAACWASVGAQIARLAAIFSTLAAMLSGTIIQPRRQPVMWKYFEKLLMTMMLSSSSSAERGCDSYDSPR